ncbi:hypothetical protein [Oleiharenicola sp. Vm1]|uniref:hypothetical protein n=1 Tax=Oleiharenicola sp. Vm1 TaxID=3398393 RepID=UPI0039F44DE9
MKAGYTYSAAWLIAAIVSIAIFFGVYLFGKARLTEARNKTATERDAMDQVRRDMSELAPYTVQSLDAARQRVAAVTSKLARPDAANDFSWIGREWTYNAGKPESKEGSGYQRERVNVARTTLMMADWASILNDLAAWEKRPGVTVSALSVRASGNESGRTLDQFTATLDIYSAVK